MQPDTIITTEPSVACDGNTESGGHPKVYLDVSKKGFVVCPYCSRRFELKDPGKNKQKKSTSKK